MQETPLRLSHTRSSRPALPETGILGFPGRQLYPVLEGEVGGSPASWIPDSDSVGLGEHPIGKASTGSCGLRPRAKPPLQLPMESLGGWETGKVKGQRPREGWVSTAGLQPGAFSPASRSEGLMGLSVIWGSRGQGCQHTQVGLWPPVGQVMSGITFDAGLAWCW